MSQVTEVGIDTRIKLDGASYTVSEVEICKKTRKAEVDSVRYENQLRVRKLNRYMKLTVAEFKRGDVIEEEWEVVRVKSPTQCWNVYKWYTVRKEQE